LKEGGGGIYDSRLILLFFILIGTKKMKGFAMKAFKKNYVKFDTQFIATPFCTGS